MAIRKKKILLVGASIGNKWNLENFPTRAKYPNITIKYEHGGSSFDKSEKINEILRRSEKTDYIIIKECAAYFPVDPVYYKKMIEKWVKMCRENKINPILSTVIPVTKRHEIKKNLYYFILRRSNDLIKINPCKDRKNRSIVEYNNWIRGFAKSNGILVIDLAKALKSEKDEHINSKYARLDGLHLNQNGYYKLDKLLYDFIKSLQ